MIYRCVEIIACAGYSLLSCKLQMILWTFINLLIEALVCLMEGFINLNKDFPFNTIRINFQTSDKTPITVIHNLFFAACNPSLPTLISVLVIRKPTQRDLTLGITARIPTRSLVQPGFIFSALEILLQFCLSLCRSPWFFLDGNCWTEDGSDRYSLPTV